MKLLFCDSCGDVFNLKPELKTCACGQVKGRYVDNTHAQVNGKGFSLGIGNGSLMDAIAHVYKTAPNKAEDFRKTGDVWRKHATSIICWARPHEGPANSHTTIVEDL